jgi:hypothetical protein
MSLDADNDNILVNAHRGNRPADEIAAAAYIRAHDPAPTDLLAYLGLDDVA